MNKLIIAGTRTFVDYELLNQILHDKVSKIDEIVSGTCAGADKLGERFAKEHNIPVKRFPANWDLYGRAAGPIRNKQMADYATHLLVFWDGKSRGTASMISLAKQQGLKIRVVKI